MKISISKRIRSLLCSLADLNKLETKTRLRITPESPVVSLTTVPKRIANIKPTIVSLMKQNLPPQKIILNIGADYFRGHEIPDFLQGLALVQINKVEKDLGPATKFLYTLKSQKQDQLIVVVDDDMFYSSDLLETLVAADKKYSTASICINGLRVPKSLVSADRESDRDLKSGERRVAIVEGCGGYTLRPRYFKTDLFDLTDAPLRAFFDDDFWISGHLSKNKIPKYQVSLRGKRKSLVNTLESAISGDREALQTQMMNYFANDWADEEYER